MDAISFAVAAPLLDAESCVGCGTCVAVCPTDVYDSDDTTEQTLLRAVTEQDPTDVAAVCVRRADPRQAPVAATAVVTHSRCLGSLDAGDLLALSHHGKRRVTLDDSLCENCPVGSAHEVIASTVDAARALLLDEDQIVLATMVPSVEPEPSDPGQIDVIDGAHPFLTRRGLFLALGRVRGMEKGDETIPRSRARLLEQLAGPGPFAAGRTPLADVQIDQGPCSACMACVQFCPTHALTKASDDDRFTLSFLPAVCLDCGICAVACPESAIQFGATIVEWETTRTVVSGELAACQSCATPTAARPDDADGQILCTWCRHGSGAVRPLHDGAGLFDDLNHHIDG